MCSPLKSVVLLDATVENSFFDFPLIGLYPRDEKRSACGTINRKVNGKYEIFEEYLGKE